MSYFTCISYLSNSCPFKIIFHKHVYRLSSCCVREVFTDIDRSVKHWIIDMDISPLSFGNLLNIFTLEFFSESVHIY